MKPTRPGEHNPLTMALTEAFESLMRSMMFCLPGKVLSFNPDDQTAQVECGIQRVIGDQGITIPVIENVPVKFAGDGEWYFWHQVKPGTEGLIHFSQRAIDTWLDQGGPAKPHDTRMCSAEDAFFVPGIRSRPGKIPNFKNEGVGMSDYDGSTFIHLTPGQIDITAATLNINAATNIKGVTDINGDVSTTGALKNNGINVGSTHKHPYTWTDPAGAGNTGNPA